MCADITLNEKIECSVVVPVKNEEKYIENFIQNILNQDIDLSTIEVIFADGKSTDMTKAIIDKYIEKYADIFKCYNNDKENAPSGVNLGIKNAQGNIIIRMDVHTEYSKNYISKNLYYLKKTGADNVGCPIETVGSTFVAKSIANVLSSKFGVGNSMFRTTKVEGYVDTVPFGCFKKSLIDKIGFFDEDLPRSEDNEFNYKIRENNGKVYMFNEISSIYHSRTTLKSLWNMGIANGRGIIDLYKKNKKAISIRHIIPLLFFVGNLCGILICLTDISFFKYMYLFVLAVYMLCDIFYSFKAIKKVSFFGSVLCLLIYPLFHISYGLGSFMEIVRLK